MTNRGGIPGIAAIATVAIAVGVLMAGCPGESSTANRTARIDKGEVAVTISATGTLAARKSTRIHSEVRMEAKIIYLVEEGSMVEAGDVLVKLDPTDLEKRMEELERQITNQTSSLEVATVELSITESDAKNSVAKAEMQLEQASKELEKYEQGDAPIQERKLEIAVQENKSARDRAKTKYDQMPQLLAEGFVTASQVEEERITYEKAKVSYESSVSELALFRKYTRPMEIDRKKSNITQAESDLRAVRMRTQSQIKQRKSVVLQNRNSLTSLQKELEDLTGKLDKMVIKAPTGGLVIYGDVRERRRRGGEDEIKVGTRVWPQHTIITLPDLSAMNLVFQVHEADVNKLRQDMKGKITVASAPDRTWEGVIEKVADLATQSGWRSDPNVKMFEVIMLIRGQDPLLKPGGTAEVHIVSEVKSDAMRVPISAIHGMPGEYFVFLENGAGFQRKPVDIGLVSDAFAEVLTGVQLGDTVLLGAPETPVVDIPEEEEGEAGKSPAAGKDAKGRTPSGAREKRPGGRPSGGKSQSKGG